MEKQFESTLMSLESSSSVPVFENNNPFPKIPYISILSDRIVLFQANECPVLHKCPCKNSLQNLVKNKPSGIISRAACSRIRKIIDTWLNSIEIYNNQNNDKLIRKEHYPIFITLTLSAPQIKSDNDIKRNMLSQFINKLSNNHAVKHLFWRAEKQKNGNIHFHIITDKYIDKDKIRKYWNDIQEKEGYIEIFEKKWGHKNPPSTKIQSASSVKNFINYVLKYITKKEENSKVEGRIYGMTDSLRMIKSFTTTNDSLYSEEIKEIVTKQDNRIIKQDYATIIMLNRKKTTELKKLSIIHEYKQYLLQVYSDLYFTPFEFDISGEIASLKTDSYVQSIHPFQMSIFDVCPDYCMPIIESVYDSEHW
jgi:hypothetical protein